ncbi:MAG: DUF4139 domain-containing protein [Lysobacter sp.]
MKPLSLLALAIALTACSAPSPNGDAKPDSGERAGSNRNGATESASTRLTVYSGDYEALSNIRTPSAGMPGYALVERSLKYPLKQGRNPIAEKDLPPSMDVEAAVLQPRGSGVSVVGQRYVAPVAGAQNVIGVAIGRKVSVEHTAGGAKQTDSGVLLAAGDGLTLALDDGRVKVIRSYDSFSLVDNDNVLPRQSALQWTVDATQAGDAEFGLSYPMGGMAWRAEYLATLAPGGGCKLALDGAALVANRSGRAFDGVRLSLIAGEPNRVRNNGPQYEAYAAPPMLTEARAVAADAAGVMPVQRTAGEYHAYDLPQPASLDNGGTERIALFPRNDAVACERVYSLEASEGGWDSPTPLIDRGYAGPLGDLPVMSKVEFKNDKASGLGLPLPAGRVRAFDGADFLGESQLGHTAAGAQIKLELGKVFDLSAKREATAFQLDRTGRTITESFAVTIKNAKKNPATVRVTEPLPRWSDWEIVSSSLPSKKKDARHAEFEVAVPAGGETKLTYTVRYRWPQDVKP